MATHDEGAPLMAGAPRGVRAGYAAAVSVSVASMAAASASAGGLPSERLGATSTEVGSNPRPRRPDGRIVTVHSRSTMTRWLANPASRHAGTGSGELITSASVVSDVDVQQFLMRTTQTIVSRVVRLSTRSIVIRCRCRWSSPRG